MIVKRAGRLTYMDFSERIARRRRATGEDVFDQENNIIDIDIDRSAADGIIGVTNHKFRLRSRSSREDV